MTTDEQVIAQLVEANPVSESGPHTAQEQAEADRVLQRVLRDAPGRRGPRRPRPRAGLGLLAPAISVVVVVVVAAVILRSGGGSQPTGSTPSGGTTITLQAEPTPQVPRITASAMARQITLIRRRLGSLGAGFTVAQSGASRIVVTVPKAHAAERARVVRLVGQSAQLYFYDWEANVLTPTGTTAASQLLTQDPAAMSLSQGASDGAGLPGAGSMPLYQAVTLAAKQQPARHSRFQSRPGQEYYVFGAPGSHACAALAAIDHTKPVPNAHCLLAGPLDLGSGAGPHQAVAAAAAQYPSGVIPARAQVLIVPQGTVVLQGEQSHPSAPVPFDSPQAQFFVLRDHVALISPITEPRASTDASGEADVTFGFTGTGRAAFGQLTRAVARRGANVSVAGATLPQHFAVALDNQLITVPEIDFHQYPDGVAGGGRADIAGGLTAQSAQDLATELRYGALPLAGRVVP